MSGDSKFERNMRDDLFLWAHPLHKESKKGFERRIPKGRKESVSIFVTSFFFVHYGKFHSSWTFTACAREVGTPWRRRKKFFSLVFLNCSNFNWIYCFEFLRRLVRAFFFGTICNIAFHLEFGLQKVGCCWFCSFEAFQRSEIGVPFDGLKKSAGGCTSAFWPFRARRFCHNLAKQGFRLWSGTVNCSGDYPRVWSSFLIAESTSCFVFWRDFFKSQFWPVCHIGGCFK